MRACRKCHEFEGRCGPWDREVADDLETLYLNYFPRASGSFLHTSP